jgi:hypothetical protein
MAREPQIEASRYAEMVSLIDSMGYDIGQLREVPQQW